MKSLRLIPGQSIGDFTLGSTVTQILQYLQSNRSTYPRVNIRNDDNNGIIITLPWESLQLTFTTTLQMLTSIQVLALTQVDMNYNGVTFCGLCVPATFRKLYQAFGPTKPGAINADAREFVLTYEEGASITFPIPSAEVAYVLSSNKSQVPYTLSDGTEWLAQKVSVFSDKVSRSVAQLNRASIVVAEVGDSQWDLSPRWGGRSSQSSQGFVVHSSDQPQDVITTLGEPESIATTSQDSALYSFSYYNKGVEILFNTTTHTLTAVVFHTNSMCKSVPCSTGNFEPCPFSIRLREEYYLHTDSLVVAGDLEGSLGYDEPVLCGNGCRLYQGDGGIVIEVLPNDRIRSVMMLTQGEL
eukprot:PhF_6_TR20836/c0_g1_i2/m.30004